MNFFINNAIILCIAVIFSGCSLHKPTGDYTTTNIPVEFNSGSKNSKPDISSKWWLKFNDENLNRIMDEVLKSNMDIEAAYQRLSQATAYTKNKSSDLFPQLNIIGSGKNEDTENYNSAVNSYSVSLAASYELDLWGKIRSAKQAAKFKKKASMFDLQAVYISVSAKAAELYFRTTEKKETLFLCREKVRLRHEYLEIADLNYKQGIVDSSTLYSARKNLASAEAELILQNAAYRKLFHALSILQGKYPEHPEKYSLPELNDFNEEINSGIPSELLKNRPDIQKSLAGLTAADFEIGVAIANRFPSINLTAGIGESGTDIMGEMSSAIFNNVAGNLLIPVLDWGKRKAEVKRVKAKFQETLSLYKRTVLNGFKETEDALVEYSASSASLEKFKQVEINTAATYEQLKNKYNYGLTNYNAVISSKTANIDAKKRLIEARLDLLLKNISLVRALGGTWMNEEIKKKLAQR